MVGAPDLQEPTLAVYQAGSGAGLAEAFGKLADLGYDGVELMTKDPMRLDVAHIQQELDNCGLELAGLCTGHVYGEDALGLVGPEPEVARQAMARLKEYVDVAAQLRGAASDGGVLVNIGRSRGPGYPDDLARTLDEMEAAFRELAEHAAPHGVGWVLEPINVHQANHIHTTQDGIEMVRRVDHANFGLMLDVYHMNIEDDDIYASFRAAEGLCWFVHFADNNRKWPGCAHLDFQRICDVLVETRYDGYLSFEILPWPDPDTAAQAAIDSIRRYIPSEPEEQR